MDKNTRIRAYAALMNAKPNTQGKHKQYEYFAQLWVVDSEICFTENSAKRAQHNHYFLGEFGNHSIEVVTIAEAMKYFGLDVEKSRTRSATKT